MELVINNRQRARPIDREFLKGVTEHLLDELLVTKVELGVHLVTAEEMSRVHKQYMNIEGSTDVITFDHGSRPPEIIHGEIFISVEDAIAQAREFKTAWQSELVRYVAHGILHLLAYDDLEPRARAKMKREENRLLRQLESTFKLRDVEKR
jgi:probable rRNA maturation factor